MKKYIYIIVATIFCSCSNFLEEKLYSTLAAEDIYTTEEGIYAALNGVYNALSSNAQGQDASMWGQNIHYMLNLGTDELIPSEPTRSAEPGIEHAALFNYNTESELFSSVWFGHYVGINRVNLILKYIDDIEEMSTSEKTQVIAEAKFMRGFFQFYLAWLYGGVPAPREPDDFTSPRLSLEEVYTYIIEDLYEAYSNLPERNSTTGRPNKYTAAAMLGKVYLYLGSCKDNDVATDFPDLEINSFDFIESASGMHNAARLYLEEVYNSSGYYLITPYRYLFYSAPTCEELARNESMFTVLCSAGSDRYLNQMRLWGPQGMDGVYGWIRPLGELYYSYNTDDPRGTHNFTGNQMYDSTYVDDPDDCETIDGWDYRLCNAVNASGTSCSLSKVRTYKDDTNGSLGISDWASIYDWPIIRFADIILMLAEIEYFDFNYDACDAYLHELRLRVANSYLDDEEEWPQTASDGTVCSDADAFASYLDVVYHNDDRMTEILAERMRELCGEGYRRFDLVRTGRLASTIAGVSGTTYTSYDYYNGNQGIAQSMKDNFEPFKVWYPIPKRELDTNTNLVQNYGY